MGYWLAWSVALLGAVSPSPAQASGDCNATDAVIPVLDVAESTTQFADDIIVDDGAAAYRNSESIKKCSEDQRALVQQGSFTKKEERQIRTVMAKMANLLGCVNSPVRGFSKINFSLVEPSISNLLTDNTCEADRRVLAVFVDGTLVFTDSLSRLARTKGSQRFRGTVAHEIAHVLGEFDPRTCKTYKRGHPYGAENGAEYGWYSSPVVQEFMTVVGWSYDRPFGDVFLVEKPGSAESSWWSGPANRPPSRYIERLVKRRARTGPEEDLAESVAFFITNPALLRKRSPARYEFVKKFFESLGGVGEVPPGS